MSLTTIKKVVLDMLKINPTKKTLLTDFAIKKISEYVEKNYDISDIVSIDSTELDSVYLEKSVSELMHYHDYTDKKEFLADFKMLTNVVYQDNQTIIYERF